VAPTVNIAVKARGGTVDSLKPLLPTAPLAALRESLQRDILPLYTAVFADPSGQIGKGEGWLVGPRKEGMQEWLLALTSSLEKEVTEAFATCGNFYCEEGDK